MNYSIHTMFTGFHPMNLHLLEMLFPGWVITSADSRNGHRIIGGNGNEFFGRPGHGTISDLPALIHPDDVEAYRRSLQKIEAFLKETAPADVSRYRFGLQYRLQRGRGRYFTALEEKLFFVNEQGRTENFSLFRDVSTERPFTRVQLDLYRVHSLGYRRIGSYTPATPDQGFTAREGEILQLIKDGLSSKEIADRLSISINTVRNHRSSLFRKTQSRNMVELLNHSQSGLPVGAF
ncbi:helix-turn-helix transcriptional regulator [Larkinella soli]|uniref:helix-turn-helix transcriptional regulator n=1 Tax=Larkinella soli TaxID=1770527 RepID=UPI001E5C970C|nr:helix-turn-helix transcriptional regulator [Larkinella soli]